MRFLDSAKIYIKAGDGGAGGVSFRREKYIEFGGPDGGNGGAGGSVYFKAIPSINTLIDFRYKQHFKIKRGENGKGKNRHGAKSDDLIIPIPIGTIVWDENKENILYDFKTVGEEILIASGGMGGRGNASYKTSTNRAPRQFQPGILGDEIWVWLELQILADVGLLGMPNAGKSTLLSKLSNAKPKIADYPFTTLKPQLGVLNKNNQEVVVADIPGIIEGASLGVGLGTRFLSHLNRCNLLIHMLDVGDDKFIENYKNIMNELKIYSEVLYNKKQIIVFNKIDKLAKETLKIKIKEFHKKYKKLDTTIHNISLITMENVEQLIDDIFIAVKNNSAEGDSSNDLKDEIANKEKSWSPI
jgi:GTP-binding protein